MFINFIELENWKCYPTKRKFNFKQHQLIIAKNGTGKSSLFEAISFGIWGKAPVGFNFNTVRNNDSKQCRVFISFDLKMSGTIVNATIERIFGCAKPLSELKIDGKLVCESVRTIEAYMNELVNFRIVEQLWTSSLKDSSILRDDFFTKTILEDILKDPLSLVSHYKSKMLSMNRQINSFDDSSLLNAEEISKEMTKIKSKLKAKNKGDINLANFALDASKKIKKISKSFKLLGEKGLNESLVKEFSKIFPQRENISKNLRLELDKKNTIYSKFNHNELRKIISFSEQDKSCVICGGEFNHTHREKIESDLLSTGRSEDRIKLYQDQLALIDKFSEEDVNLYVEYLKLESSIQRCPNYDTIIKENDEQNNKLWDKFDKLQKDYAKAIKQQQDLKHINELRKEVASCKDKLSLLDEYVEDASNYYTSKLMEKASQYLNLINNRYKQICLYEGSFSVMVEQEDLALNLLPVARLSGGEKTMCALSLLFAVHNLIVPEISLLFDETFSALDAENLEQVQRFLRTQKTQIFVITHDKNWQEF